MSEAKRTLTTMIQNFPMVLYQKGRLEYIRVEQDSLDGGIYQDYITVPDNEVWQLFYVGLYCQYASGGSWVVRQAVHYVRFMASYGTKFMLIDDTTTDIETNSNLLKFMPECHPYILMPKDAIGFNVIAGSANISKIRISVLVARYPLKADEVSF